MSDAEHNPYATPEAALQEVPVEHIELASRLSRLGAALIDGLIGTMIGLPLLLALGVFEGFPNVKPLALPVRLELAVGGIAGFLAIQGYLLATRGQTVGKWLVGIRIARPDGSRADFWRIIGLRCLPLWLVSQFPPLGFPIQILDALLIFSETRRCLHDRIADTIVVASDAPP